VLITDGDNNAGKNLAARRRRVAKALKIPVYKSSSQGRQGAFPRARHLRQPDLARRRNRDQPRAAVEMSKMTGASSTVPPTRLAQRGAGKKCSTRSSVREFSREERTAIYREDFHDFLLYGFLLLLLELLGRFTVLRVGP